MAGEEDGTCFKVKRRMFEMNCPHCGHSFFIQKDAWLLYEPYGVEYKQMKDGTFFDHQCSKCGKLFRMSWPLLYKDASKGFILCLNLPEFKPEKPVLTVKTSTPEQFLEAFSILDLGLDLASVLKIKRQLEVQSHSYWKLDDYDDKNGILWFSCGKDVKEIVYHFPTIV